MKSFLENESTFTFNCDCGSNQFEREKDMKNLKSFFEGRFICVKCKQKHDYLSKCFNSQKTQISLF